MGDHVLDLMKVILACWNNPYHETSNEKLPSLGHRLKCTDLCLFVCYKTIKELMVAWDFTCFGHSSTVQFPNQVKKSTRLFSVSGSLKRIKDSVETKKRKILDDVRYVPPVPVNIAHQKLGRTRVLYTIAEDTAILKGINQIGWGEWGKIKLSFAETLKNRNNVSIKDRARTLLNNNLLQDKALIGGCYT